MQAVEGERVSYRAQRWGEVLGPSSPCSADLAQPVEHRLCNARVVGSSPTVGTTEYQNMFELLICFVLIIVITMIVVTIT